MIYEYDATNQLNVAKEKGYDYIFDKSAGALLYGKDADNILPAVKAKLGIK